MKLFIKHIIFFLLISTQIHTVYAAEETIGESVTNDKVIAALEQCTSDGFDLDSYLVSGITHYKAVPSEKTVQGSRQLVACISDKSKSARYVAISSHDDALNLAKQTARTGEILGWYYLDLNTEEEQS